MSPAAIDRPQYLQLLGADIEAFASAVDSGPLDAAVPWCGQWRLADLAVHLGGVHRWAAGAMLHGNPAGASAEAEADPAPVDASGLGAWLRAGGQRLLGVLGNLDLEGPTWHPFPVAKVGAVWPRRQAQETSVHRWDAERAIGLTPTIDPALAADGIDEYFAVALPRLMRREGVDAPAAVLLVETTDTGDRWLVAARDGTIVALDDGEPVMRLSGNAADVLLALWRRPVPASAVTVAGEPIGWLDLGGM
ncbi:MAG: maleylpyruvate isomerase family mycothiol-dependent enzyme [Ilumatobacteraceae bacterium]